ncbi:hypothetical protein RhiirA1_449947 [Rhizophagus irregularis]|uniref:Uncharacterized protein n=1 Tax=Rhizophagus irregularis TaxID=588596 RepID=A0A2N0SG19_9GLOM|nr:hypothetical protein RhiirA1_449947 [Rhizophagus irregularis]
MDFVTASCNPSGCSMLAADIPHTSFDIIDEALPTPHLLTAGDVAASSSVVLSLDSQYTFYTDGSLINLGTCDVSMGWGWPSSSRAEAAAIYAALSASPANSVVHIYTDSQSSIEGLKHCFLSDYSDSRLYYKTTNFELWAIIQQLIVDKQLSVLPFKIHPNTWLTGLLPGIRIPHLTAMNVVAAIHNNFINKFRKRIWNPRSYDKGLWEHTMNISSKLKQSSRPKGLLKSSYLPYSSLPPPTHVDSRDSRTDWLKNSMQYGLSWFNHISGFMGRLTVLLNNRFCRMECRF